MAIRLGGMFTPLVKIAKSGSGLNSVSNYSAVEDGFSMGPS